MIDLQPRQEIFTQRDCPKNVESLCSFLKERVDFSSNLTGLRIFFDKNPHFFSEVLPFLWAEARHPMAVVHPLREKKTIVCTQLESLRILVHSFWCSFRRDSYRWGAYPSINMDRLFVSSDSIFYAKLCMFFQYFTRQQMRLRSGEPLSRKLVFSLRSVSSSLVEWEECNTVLQPFVVHPLRASIDDAKDCFRVDFANHYLGGAALSHGCVQEEIMFALLPELNVGRLFSAKMRDEESIVIQGAEQFSISTGYGWSFRNAGPYKDSTEIRQDMLQSHIVAMDAVDYRNAFPTLQYSDEHIVRDLNKSYAGFSAAGTPQRIATGNWGCGVFRGDAAFKSLIQWVSASRAQRSIEYFPFDHRGIAEEYGALTELVCTKGLRVCDLLLFLRNINPRKRTEAQFSEWVHAC